MNRAIPSSANLPFDELDWETWFRSSDIMENLCTEVSFSSVTYVPVQQPKQSDFDSIFAFEERSTTNEEDTPMEKDEDKSEYLPFKINLPPNKKICSGIAAQKQVCKTFNNESILSLVGKILYKNKLTALEESNHKLSGPISFDAFAVPLQDGTRIGDEIDFLANLLARAASESAACKQAISKCLDQLNEIHSPKKSPASSSLSASSPITTGKGHLTDEEMKTKSLKAKARQQKLLAQMSANQMAFLQNPSNKVDVEAYKESSSYESSTMHSRHTPTSSDMSASYLARHMKQSPTDSSFTKEATSSPLAEKMEHEETEYDDASQSELRALEADEVYDCCICRISSQDMPDKPMGVMALVQVTSVLGHRESLTVDDPSKMLPLSDATNFRDLETETMCWRQEEKRAKLMQEAFSTDSCKTSLNIGWRGGIYSLMCGHYLHFDCYNSYKKSVDGTTGSIAENIRSTLSINDFSCPMCRQTVNCVLPISSLFRHEAQPTTASRYSTEPSTSSDLSRSLTSSEAWIFSSQSNKTNVKTDSDATDASVEAMKRYLTKTRGDDMNEEVLQILATRSFSTSQNASSSALIECKNDALATITATTPLEFRYLYKSLASVKQPQQQSSVSATPPSYMQPQLVQTDVPMPIVSDEDVIMFAESVLRTQLEVDLMLKQNTACNMNTYNFAKKRSCFVPLFDVIATHCRLMCQDNKQHMKHWMQLFDYDVYSQFAHKLNLEEKMESFDNMTSTLSDNHLPEVPMLLKDPISVLLLIVVNLPTRIHKKYFSHVVSRIFNLVFVQSVISLSLEMDAEERAIWPNKSDKASPEQATELKSLGDYFRFVNTYLKEHGFNFPSDEANKNRILSFESGRNHIETKCLHFLKIAALLQSYLYDQEIKNSSDLVSFGFLINYLRITFSPFNTNDAQPLLMWSMHKSPQTLLSSWLDELASASAMQSATVRSLVGLSFNEYHFPRLLELPYQYSDLFGYYSLKTCMFCNRTPKETAICLLCGAHISYKTHACCDQMQQFNKGHYNTCGAGTFVLININSTSVYLWRGKKCAPWASLYLDEHGEEDPNLRRGKPLFLNKARYDLLQSTWASHAFDYQSLKWYNTSLFIF